MFPEIDKTNVQEISLKAILGIEKQKICLLKTFCNDHNINCDGKKYPWCELEIKIRNKELSPFTLSELKKEKVISIFNNLQNNFKIKEYENLKNVNKSIFESKADFKCPYFRKEVNNCSLKVCPYYSLLVKNTNCILSIEEPKHLSISQFIILKEIPKKNLLRLVFGIEIGNKWDSVETLIKQSLITTNICEHCGSLADTCYNDQKGCKKRQKIKTQLKDESIIPDRLFKYPIILILISSYKVFGNWFEILFSKKLVNAYLKI